MRTKLLAMVLLAGGSMFAQTRFSIGIGGYGPGYYQPYPSVQAVVPPCPGPDYNWVDGYWSPYGVRVSGYWARRPLVGAYQFAPRYAQPRFDNRYSDAYRRNTARRLEHGNRYENGFRGR
jgi:hypothetical protein